MANIHERFVIEKIRITHSYKDTITKNDMLREFKYWFIDNYTGEILPQRDKTITKINYTDIGSFYDENFNEWSGVKFV